MSYGLLVSTLKEMNEVMSWRKIVGKEKIDKRLRDVELVLRCLALAEDHGNYEKPMKGFLNSYMEKHRNATDFTALKDNFKRSCDYILSELGEKPFHLRGRLNYGALDSVMVAVLTGINTSCLENKFSAVRLDANYNEAITYNTSDEAAVKIRIDKSIEFLADQ